MSNLTVEERATLTARLKEAEDAYHRYQTGQSVRVFVDQNGERVEYTVNNMRQLPIYIATLRHQLGIGSGRLGPMRVRMVR